jgi:uncharacterized membrane protein YeaQ/YmgE (transglycosylase-associated protein family)
MLSILWTILIGFVVGVIAKFLHPGKEDMGIISRRSSASPAPSSRHSSPPAALQGRRGAGLLMALVGAIALVIYGW